MTAPSLTADLIDEPVTDGPDQQLLQQTAQAAAAISLLGNCANLKGEFGHANLSAWLVSRLVM